MNHEELLKLCDEIEALLKAATPGPVYVAQDDANDCPPHANSGLALIDTGRHYDPPFARLCEWNEANLMAALVNAAQPLIDAARESVRLREELEGALATMMAAAVEIKEHWDDHCDMDGYGPSNLLRRLERGFTDAGYGYTAQGWIDLTNECDTLRAELNKVRKELDEAYERDQPAICYQCKGPATRHFIHYYCDTCWHALGDEE